MTLIDLFREFSSVATREKYSPSSRILYYTLLWCWNEQRRPEIATSTMNELCTLTGLPRTTIQSAFGYIADRGWVKRVKSRNRQVFSWLMRDSRLNVGTPACFPLSRAQSSSLEEGRIAPQGDSSRPTKETEPHVQSRSGSEIGSSDVNTTIRGVQGTAATPTAVDSGNVPDDLWG